MSLTPIDAKTSFLTNNDASRLRENQKAQELGAGQFVNRQQEKDQEKVDTLRETQAAEGKVVRKEDEDAEKSKSKPDSKQAKGDSPELTAEENKAAGQIPDPEGRGIRIDIKI